MKAKIKEIEIDLIKQALQNNTSLAGVCKELGCCDNTCNRDYLKNLIEKYSIDISHHMLKAKPVTRQDYNKNPKKCKYCGEIIPFEKRKNNFCNHSCSASYNNADRDESVCNKQANKIIKLNNINDNDFIKIIDESKTWAEILIRIGYSQNSNSNIKQRIRNRCDKLNISLNIKEGSKKIDWNTITKGQLFQKAENWQSARTTIRKIAKKNFELANKQYKCAVCGYNKHAEIAHIKAVSDFDDSTTIEEINSPDNLIGLCPNHHWEYDNGLLDINLYLK